MKGEVPGCEPGIFPLVRHRDDISDNKVSPIAVAPVLPVFRRGRLSRMAIEPMLHIEVIKLLVPQHSSEGLTLYSPDVLVDNASLERGTGWRKTWGEPDEAGRLDAAHTKWHRPQPGIGPDCLKFLNDNEIVAIGSANPAGAGEVPRHATVQPTALPPPH